MIYFFNFFFLAGKGNTRCPPPVIPDFSEDDNEDEVEYVSDKNQELESHSVSGEDNDLESLPVTKLKERLASEVNHSY